MGGSYRQCGECGKRALSIATRCPGCGREFELPAEPEVGPGSGLGRYVSPAAAGLAALAAIVLAVELGGAGGSAGPARAPAAAESDQADSLAASSEVAYALGATARLDTASVEPTPEPGTILVAKTWTNVRKARSRRADLEAVLTPGDSVFADSLHRDWYRIAFQGEVLGYAHRITLARPGSR
jgi:hypothetical protein